MNIKPLLFSSFLLLSFSSLNTHAVGNTFEVGTGSIANTLNGNPAIFTTFTFDTPFIETPLVFLLPSTQGGDECDARIRNVTLTTFDAYCTEAPPRDGEHVAVTIQYLATTSGSHAVPITGGGTVTFAAGFIGTQNVQHNCASGCGTKGWDIVTPGGVNAANAAILSQIQTMANESSTPPSTSSTPFMTTAMDLNQGTSSQFGLALERNEVNNGSITMDERIAWLAVEDSGGCVTLDFSSFGGPAAVPFQSIITDDDDDTVAGSDIHDAVDGFTDGNNRGCQTDEGATFASGCFTTTPVVLANKRTRNEIDGGWLRQCFIGSNEIRLTIDEDRDRDNERSHALEGVSVVAFGQSFTTPVTLNQIEISQNNRDVYLNWETATETFNIGFNVWGKVEQNWEQLNKRLIPSHRRDKLRPKHYQHHLRLSPYQRDQITEFGISSVDTSGKDEFFGPFLANTRYGEQSIPEPIDWSTIKLEFENRMLAQGLRFIRGRWVKPETDEHQDGQQRIDLHITQTGMYSIRYEDLLSQGIEWDGVAARHIAITHKGKAVARRVVPKPSVLGDVQPVFGAGAHIEFFATTALSTDALYIHDNVYQLQLDRSLAQRMSIVKHRPSRNAVALTQGLEAVSAGENRLYSAVATGDPWMDHELFSFGAPAEKNYSLVLPEYIDPTLEGRLEARLSGAINLGGDQPDHHLLVYINDQLLADELNDGFKTWTIDIEIPAGVLLEGENVVRFELPGDTGLIADIVNIDFVTLSGQKSLQWSTSDLAALQFDSSPGAEAYRVELNDIESLPEVFITRPDGNIARVSGIRTFPALETTSASMVLPTVAMQKQLSGLSYWVGHQQQMLTPEIERVVLPALFSEPADYLIIAHPNFIGATLDRFAESKREQGYVTRIIDWLDIVKAQGYGMPTPDALTRFLQTFDRQSGFDYVLLVGGHSYDYHDYLEQNSISFLPTWYRPQSIFKLAPTDTPFVDLTANGLPDKAIGRWPVRTEQDLLAIIQKTNDWQQNTVDSSGSALFIASKTAGNLNYAQHLENSMDEVTKKWRDIDRVYLDDFIASNPDTGVEDARQRLFSRINQGVDLTVFNGHGSPSSWSFQNLVNWQNLQTLENSDKPTLVLPLACYSTYYEAPSVNSLAHQWLFGNNANGESTGAVAIHGAMVLSDYKENMIFADRVLRRQLDKGMTIGQAILRSKREQAPWNVMINNWALLGDPSLKLSQ